MSSLKPSVSNLERELNDVLKKLNVKNLDPFIRSNILEDKAKIEKNLNSVI